MFSDPEKNIEALGIQPGMEIADFGAGSGHYSILAAKHLMSTGRVYAVDVHADMLSRLKNVATKEKVYNIQTITADIEKPNGSRLRDSSVDLVLLCNVLFQLDDKGAVIKEIKRVLKPGGRILVVDWADSFGHLGPHPSRIVKKEMVQENFSKAGFHMDREISAGSHHYGMIFKKL